MEYFAYYFIIINLLGVIFVLSDKRKARKNKWRVPEKTFFIITILGGGLGTYITMRRIRHKTLHKRFMIGLPILIILWFSAFIYIYLKIRGVI